METGTRTLKPVTHRNPTRSARVNGLTDVGIRNARARDRAYKLADGRGLCLLVQPSGSKWWRFRYEWAGKERMLSMGTLGSSISACSARALSHVVERAPAYRRPLVSSCQHQASSLTTGVVLLAESHISIHTWPESDFAALDIFMCGAANPQRALDALVTALAPASQHIEFAARGRGAT